jgi:hypothetical protein
MWGLRSWATVGLDCGFGCVMFVLVGIVRGLPSLRGGKYELVLGVNLAGSFGVGVDARVAQG